MKKYFNYSLAVVLLAGVLLLVACPKRVSIADIEADPSKYRDKELAIAGTVKDSYGLNIPGTSLKGGVYKVDDGTGSMWVVTEDGVPAKGSQIGVKGKVTSGLNWNGRNYGLGMRENDRRTRGR